MPPHKLRITKDGAGIIAQYLALYDFNPVLQNTVLEQMQVIAHNPSIGREYNGPGRLRKHIFQCMLDSGTGVVCCLTYQVTADEVYVVGCGRVAL